jgi:lysophospholipase L1-like esterase
MMIRWIQRFLMAAVALLVFVSALTIAEFEAASRWPKVSHFTNPSHEPIRLGTRGPSLIYVVIGDSTGAGQGASYKDGIAMGTAAHLALTHRVTMINLSVSGALAADVIKRELPEACALKPDIVLLSVGANDATHFTSTSALLMQIVAIADGLRKSSPRVKIIVTGCPQMGAVPRFAQPLRWFAGVQTARINAVFRKAVVSRHIIWAHIADRTGAAFKRDPSLFANDKFHPNGRGYALWIPVINEAADN